MKTVIMTLFAVLFSTTAYAQFNWFGLQMTLDQLNQSMALEQARRNADNQNRLAAEALNLRRQQIANEKAALDAMARQNQETRQSSFDTMKAMILSVQNTCNPTIRAEVNEKTAAMAHVIRDNDKELVYDWGPLFWDGSPDRDKGMTAVLLGEVDRCDRGGPGAKPRDVFIQFHGHREVVYRQDKHEAQLLK